MAGKVIDQSAMINARKRVTSSGGEPPDMDARIRHLEQDVAVIRANYATREDIASLRAEMHSVGRQSIMWNVGTLIALTGIVVAVLRLV